MKFSDKVLIINYIEGLVRVNIMKKNSKFPIAGHPLSDKSAMELALNIAQKGRGHVEPNPPVACVILNRHNKLLSFGWHKKYGGAHAEVEALKKIKNKAQLKGAKVFVTLEPCHHYGKTPPCSKELVKHPIHSVTYGATDPLVDKKGVHFLKRKGIKIIHSSDFKKEAEELVAPFKFSVLNKKPFVSLKIASSLDGVSALTKGESQWITSEKARQHARFLRATHSAVLIGVNTLLKDNPRLDIRLSAFKKKKNKVVILDPKGQSFSFLSRSQLLKAHSADEIIVFCAKNVKTPPPPKDIKVKSFSSSPKSLSKILEILYQEEGLQSLLVEGGPYCWSQFLKNKIAQRLYLYMAPRIIGKGLHWSKDFTISSLSKSVVLNSLQCVNIGKDYLFTARFPW